MLERFLLYAVVFWECWSYTSAAANTNNASNKCRYDCPVISDWLCGDDDISYINQCEFDKVQCETQRSIRVRHPGQCIPSSVSVDRCASVVCGVGMRCRVWGQHDPHCVCSNLCSTDTNEVCGSDGFTHMNVCYLRALACKRRQNVYVKKNGPCEDQSNPCLKMKCPAGVCRLSKGQASCVCWHSVCVKTGYICGTNGKNYASLCHLLADSCKTRFDIQKAYSGRCNKQLCKAAKCRDSCRVKDGKAKCYCKNRCQPKADHVCGDDGQTYINQCRMKRKACQLNTRIKVAHKGRCTSGSCRGIDCGPGRRCVSSGSVELCQCNDQCPRGGPPVCGENSVTYSSKCHLDYASCTSGVNIRIGHPGPCDLCLHVNCSESQKCVERNGCALCICTRDGCDLLPPPEDAVCGTNEISYASECLLKYDSCRSGRNNSVMYNGNCSHNCGCHFGASCVIRDRHHNCQCIFNCTGSPFSPVCVTGGRGSQNYTYPNNCTVQQTACENQTELMVLYDGPCRNACINVTCGYGEECIVKKGRPHCTCWRNCSVTTEKVCGSDGITYHNECVLSAKSCLRASNVTLAHVGACHPSPMDPCQEMNCSRGQRCVAHSNSTAECVCNEACSFAGSSVCGTDRVTYSNRCLLELASCRKGRTLSVLREGDCLPANASEADECERCRPEVMKIARRKACSPDAFVACVVVEGRLVANLSSFTSRYNVTIDRVFKQPVTGNIEMGTHELRMIGLIDNCHCPLDNRGSVKKFAVGGRVEIESGQLVVDRTGFVRDFTILEDALWQLALQPADSLCS